MSDTLSKKMLQELRQRLLRFDADLGRLKASSETFILDQLELARECIADSQLLAVKAIGHDGEERCKEKHWHNIEDTPEMRARAAAKLRSARIEQGLSITDFAELVGVDLADAYDYEAGKVDVQRLLLACRKLGVYWHNGGQRASQTWRSMERM